MWNNKKPLIENPSSKQNIQSGTIAVAAASKKPDISKSSVTDSDGKTTQPKDVSNLMGWQIY